MTTESPANIHAHINANSSAQKALEVVIRRAFPIPKSVQDAVGVVDELDAAVVLADPSAPDLPTVPSKVSSTLTEASQRIVVAAQVRKLAAELKPAAIKALNESVVTAGKDWTSPLCEEFLSHLTDLRNAAPLASRVGMTDVSDLTPDQFSAWTSVATAVRELESLAADRAVLASLLGEQTATHWGTLLPIIAEVASPPFDEPSKVADAFRERKEFKDVMAESDAIIKWYRLLELEQRGWITLGLAPANGLLQRTLQIKAWPDSFWALQSQDGGRGLAQIKHETAYLWHDLVSV